MKKDNFYVGVQLALFAFYTFAPAIVEFTIGSFVKFTSAVLTLCGIGVIAISILQLNKNLSPFPTPKKGGELVTTGLYSIVRHPIYLGILLLFFGYGIYTGSLVKIAITIILGILFHFKSNYEEELLVKGFSDYASYKKATNKIFPFI